MGIENATEFWVRLAKSQFSAIQSLIVLYLVNYSLVCLVLAHR